MDKQARDFLFKLLRSPSPSGNETSFQRVWLDYVKKFAEVSTDHTGNAIGSLNPHADFKVMLAGHSDEIGLVINRIDEKGFIYFTSNGGINGMLLPGLKVTIHGFKKTIRGVIGFNRKSDSSLPNPGKCEDFFIDCGFSSKKEVEKYVRVGDYALYESEPEEIGNNMIVCKGLDNKTGSFIVAEILRRLSRKKLKVGVFAVSTTGEETNMRGAHAAAAAICPGMGIAVDVTFNTDTPSENCRGHAEVTLGAGPALSLGSPVNCKVNRMIEQTAARIKVPLQLELTPSRTSTDADKIMFTGKGVPVALLSLPVRYMHSPIEMASLKDIEAVIDVLSAFIESLTGKEELRPVLP